MNFGYTLYQVERPKTPAERRAENRRLGELAATLTRPGTKAADAGQHGSPRGRTRTGKGAPLGVRAIMVLIASFPETMR
jgi:hypothetical protein